MSKNLRKGEDSATLSLAVNQVVGNLGQVTQKLTATDVMEDVLEPLEQFISQFTNGTQAVLKESE